MAKTLVGALALASVPSALAFRNTSPFFLFSTADLNANNETPILHSSKITSDVIRALDKCPSQTYIIVRQDSVSSSDYLDGLSTPRLGYYVSGKDADINTIMAVPEAVGRVDLGSISSRLQRKCGVEYHQFDGAIIPPRKQDDPPRVIEVMFTEPSSNRAASLGKSDALLEKLISASTNEDYTVIYTTTPQTNEQAEATLQNEHRYEMEDPFGEAVQMELKRDVSSHGRRQKNAKKEGGLFEKYQYFSPGIFMAFAAIIPLFLILFVGLRALSSLEVSYFAFSKEMGPTAQKKQ